MDPRLSSDAKVVQCLDLELCFLFRFLFLCESASYFVSAKCMLDYNSQQHEQNNQQSDAPLQIYGHCRPFAYRNHLLSGSKEFLMIES